MQKSSGSFQVFLLPSSIRSLFSRGCSWTHGSSHSTCLCAALFTMEYSTTGVYAVFLFIGTFALGALRAYIPKLTLTSVFGCIVLDVVRKHVFCLTESFSDRFSVAQMSTYGPRKYRVYLRVNHTHHLCRIMQCSRHPNIPSLSSSSFPHHTTRPSHLHLSS